MPLPRSLEWSPGDAAISNYLAVFGDSRIAGALYVDGVIDLKPDHIVAHPEMCRDLNLAVQAAIEYHLPGPVDFREALLRFTRYWRKSRAEPCARQPAL